MDSTNSKAKAIHLTQLMEYQDEIKKSENDFDKILQILKRMSEIEVNCADLSESKIGKTLNKLTKVKDKQVSTFSEELIAKWKKVIKSSKEHHHSSNTSPNSNVTKPSQNSSTNVSNPSSKQSTSPPKTTNHNGNANAKVALEDKSIDPFRNKIRNLLYDSFLKHLPSEYTTNHVISKVIQIENMMHEKLEKGTKYTNRGKSLIANIKDEKNEDFRKNILNGELTPETLVTMDVKEMANQKLKNERAQVEKDMFNSLRSDWNDEHAPVFTGMYTCEKCNGRRTSSKEIQMRSADEPMTIFIRCIDCGNEWRIG